MYLSSFAFSYIQLQIVESKLRGYYFFVVLVMLKIYIYSHLALN